MAVRNDVKSIKELKGKTVLASAPGTAPYFTLAWFLKKNGLSVKDVTVANLEPAAAAQAFISGQGDAAMTYEPYLSSVRAAPDKGKIIATTLDYPMIMDTFGCTPKFIADNPKAAKAMADSYFEAARHDRQGPGQSLRDHGRRREAVAASSSATRPSTCAGRTRRPTRSSSPASCRPSPRRRRTCCWRSASSSRSPTSPTSSTRASSSRIAVWSLRLPLPRSGERGHATDVLAMLRPLEPVSHRHAHLARHPLLRPVRCGLERGPRSAATSRRPFSPTR